MASGKLEHDWDMSNMIWATLHNDLSAISHQIYTACGGKKKQGAKPVDWTQLNPYRS